MHRRCPVDSRAILLWMGMVVDRHCGLLRTQAASPSQQDMDTGVKQTARLDFCAALCVWLSAFNRANNRYCAG
jgi:hypothetical protein